MTEIALPQTESPRKSVTLSRVIMVLLFLWLQTMALCSLIPHWFNDLMQINGAEGDPYLVPGGAAAFGVAMIVPMLFLWNWGESERYRAIFRTWLLGVLFFIVMIPLRLVPQTQVLLANVLQIVLAWLFAGLLFRRFRPVDYPNVGRVALIPALLFALPWVWLHSYGSILDTVLNLLAGLAFGAAAAAIMQGVLVDALNRTGTAGWNIALGGFAVGVLLNVMVAGFGFEGMPWLLMLCVPTLGWILMAHARWGTDTPGNRQAFALLSGVAVAAPMIFVDPDELLLVLNLGGRDILAMGLIAAGIAMLIGWGLAIVALAFRDRYPTDLLPNNLHFFMGVALFALIAVLSSFDFDWHGDRLFVILNSQADLSGAAAIPDQRERASYVYSTLTDHATTTQAELRETLTTLRIRHRPYYLVNAIEVDGGPLIRLWLLTRPEVERIIDSPVLRPVYNDPGESLAEGTYSVPRDAELMWNLEMIGAPQVWEEFGARGEGIIVGQSDSGVDARHPELQDSYLGRNGADSLHWYDPWLFKTTPYDVGGHGTHTLGTVLGNQVGVAPDADFIACVNLERNLANPALYLECMQFMMAPFPMDSARDAFAGFPAQGAQVLNNSWGCPPVEGCDATSLQPAVDALRAAGIFVVASAGNSGPACSSVDNPIAIYDGAFTVGAVTRSGTVTEFSSRGPVIVDESGRTKPDIVAPGAEIFSAYPNDTYEYNDGTSMAGPHVAGAVVLMWSANPDLIGDIERTEQLLIDTATPATDTVECGDDALPNNSYGYGIINVYEAVKASFE